MYMVFCRSPNEFSSVTIGQEIEDMTAALHAISSPRLHEFWQWDDIWQFALNIRDSTAVVHGMTWLGSKEDLTWIKLAQDGIILSIVDLDLNPEWELIKSHEIQLLAWDQKQKLLRSQNPGFTGPLRDRIDVLERKLNRGSKVLADLLTTFMARHVKLDQEQGSLPRIPT